MIRFLSLIAIIMTFAASASAQEAAADSRASTGGAQTLADILERQQGLKVDETFRSEATGNPDAAAPITNQLGTLGGASDPELWRAYRFGSMNKQLFRYYLFCM